MWDHDVTVCGDRATFTFDDDRFPSGKREVTIALLPGDAEMLTRRDSVGLHRRKDVGELLRSAMTGVDAMMGAEAEHQVCGINMRFEMAGRAAASAPQRQRDMTPTVNAEPIFFAAGT